MSQSILLIHPVASVRRDVCKLLVRENVAVRESSGWNPMDLGEPDLILVAWQALRRPAESLRWLKQDASNETPRVIVLSDRQDYGVAVRSLEYGADDCVALPLQNDELLVRINASIVRSKHAQPEVRLTVGPIQLDRCLHRVCVNDTDVELAPAEFRLLAFLLENPGRVFSRDELLSRAWASNVKAGHRTVDVHIRRLRQQLERFRCEAMIQTVRGFGYRLRTDQVRA